MKISHKARRGRKRRPVPHKQHRNVGATRDPVTRYARVRRRLRLIELSATEEE